MAIRETITGVKYDELIGGPEIAILNKNVTIVKGAGILTRGTVLGKITESGKYEQVQLAAITTGSQLADCILAADVDATSADAVATVYISGRFNREKLIVRSTDTVDAHESELRDKNIYITSLK